MGLQTVLLIFNASDINGSLYSQLCTYVDMYPRKAALQTRPEDGATCRPLSACEHLILTILRAPPCFPSSFKKCLPHHHNGICSRMDTSLQYGSGSCPKISRQRGSMVVPAKMSEKPYEVRWGILGEFFFSFFFGGGVV